MLDPNTKELYLIRKKEDHGEVIHINVDVINKFVIRGVTDYGENITMVTDIENLHFQSKEEAAAYLKSEGFENIIEK
ncbi:MAG: hypothetical protein IIZ33_09320 [Erysipelotrichaceae bacterium]|nr:hypothetical protein [Erysipelotrichaceae bacterium]